MQLVFLVEEPSMEHFLNILLPKILDDGVEYCVIPHNGKSDLQKSIPRKIKAWTRSDARFVVVQDQDANDCKLLKKQLVSLCEVRPVKFIVRIACRELESWYFGDLQAVEQAYNVNLSHIKDKARFRVPDQIINPKQELKKIVPELLQIEGADRIALLIDISRNKSKSFQVFIEGVRRLCQ